MPTPHLCVAFAQRYCYVDAILRRMNTKSHLRASILARRDEIPEAVRARKSEAICAHLERVLEAAFATRPHAENAPTVAVFASMRSEVDTRPLVEASYRHGWNVCFPCMVRDAPNEPSRMEFYRIGREQIDTAHASFLDTPMRCLACSTLEHDGYQAATPAELDAVVVPLVAFDDEGNRLGYGGGNYDRLLPYLSGDALVVGVAFEEQRVPSVPVEPHDQPLSCIVSF